VCGGKKYTSKKIMHMCVEAESTFDLCSSDVCVEWEKQKKKKLKNVMHKRWIELATFHQKYKPGG
jgi:hypothetical protein